MGCVTVTHRLRSQPMPRGIPAGHAHNDYEHRRPLLDALAAGFTSIEADVWAVDGRLLLGHNAPDPRMTLRDLYLEPVKRMFHEEPDRPVVQLVLDVKSSWFDTWPLIQRELSAYPDLVTHWHGGEAQRRPVTAVITGDRTRGPLLAASTRWAAYEGRLADLRRSRRHALDPELTPMIGADFRKAFTWKGIGPMPAAERARLAGWSDAARERGVGLRWWATPDRYLPLGLRHRVWDELAAAGAAWISTDHLRGYQRWAQSRQE